MFIGVLTINGRDYEISVLHFQDYLVREPSAFRVDSLCATNANELPSSRDRRCPKIPEKASYDCHAGKIVKFVAFDNR